jgi:hypothetical protein
MNITRYTAILCPQSRLEGIIHGLLLHPWLLLLNVVTVQRCIRGVDEIPGSNPPFTCQWIGRSETWDRD